MLYETQVNKMSDFRLTIENDLNKRLGQIKHCWNNRHMGCATASQLTGIVCPKKRLDNQSLGAKRKKKGVLRTKISFQNKQN